MKKAIVPVIIILSLALSTHAQTGSILVYGNVGFNTNKNGGVPDVTNAATTGSFRINPGIGYQFNNSWTAGVEGGYNYADNNAAGIQKAYSIGAFLRNSMPVAGIFSCYTQLGVGYQGASFSQLGIVSKASGFYATLTPVISANIKNSFALNFAIGGLDYKSLKWKNTSTTQSTFGLTFGQQVSVGISKNFGGKSHS